MHLQFPVDRPWGKLRRAETGAVTASLSLGDHMADVAAVMEALLDIPVVRTRLARLGGLDDLDAGSVARLCVFTALHDIGKVNHGFQAKALPKGAARVQGHVACMWQALSDPLFGKTLGPFFDVAKNWFRGNQAREQALKAVLAHHGGPPADLLAAKADQALWKPADGYAPLAAMRTLAGEALAWFPAHATATAPLPDAFPFWHAFAGLVTLADRLGSDESQFTYPDGPKDGEPRIAFARRVAAAMVKRRHLQPETARAAAAALPWSFDALFPEFHAPAFAQATVMGEQLPNPPAGSLVVLEAETGSGKTEAAVLHFLRLFRDGVVDGMYFGLPTRASAVQIQRRIHKELQRMLGPDAAPPVTLAVPGYLRVDDAEGMPLPGFGVSWPDDEDGTLRDRGWAVEHPSRYLAGAVVVGTVDQVLLAGLDVKDSRLRAAALQRLLLVVDEVHASDIYMSSLLKNVLCIHMGAGGHALLMSATLGESARAPLLAASSGLQPTRTRGPASFADAVARPYPLVSGLGAPISPDPQTLPRKSVTVTLDERFDKLEHIAGMAVAAAEVGGARVLVIVNTVARAVAVQAAVEAAATDSIRLFTVAHRPCPHHARFAAEDRRLLDKAVAERFGRGSTAPVVLVATQTVEQSLDIDADFLITDLAPADVLLQRLGRLHRHGERSRPAGFAEARAVVLAPSLARLGGTQESAGRLGMGYGRVYPNLVGLAATRLELEHRRDALISGCRLTLSADNRALVEAATHDERLRTLAESLGKEWETVLNKCIGDESCQRKLAVQHSVKWTKELAATPEGLDEALGTRLGVSDALAVFPGAVIGSFGAPISTIKIPGWMLPPNWDKKARMEALEQPEPDLLAFRFAGVGFVYDRHGLRLK